MWLWPVFGVFMQDVNRNINNRVLGDFKTTNGGLSVTNPHNLRSCSIKPKNFLDHHVQVFDVGNSIRNSSSLEIVCERVSL